MLNEQMSSQNNANAVLAEVILPSFYVGKNVPVFLTKSCPKNTIHLFQNQKIGNKKYRRVLIAFDKKLSKSDFKKLADISTFL